MTDVTSGSRRRRPRLPGSAGAQRVDRRAALDRLQNAGEVSQIDNRRLRNRCARRRRRLDPALPGRGALPGRNVQKPPSWARPAPRLMEGSSERVILEVLLNSAVCQHRARRSRRGRRAAARDARRPRVPGRPGRVHLPLGARRARRCSAATPGDAGARRGAVELLGGCLRRRADHEGVPQDQAGREPRARAVALPQRPRVPHIASLVGWYEVEGRLIDATLGILQEFLLGFRDGWELALDELASDPEGLLDKLYALGTVIGELHSALGSDHSDPAFSPDEPSVEALSILTADVTSRSSASSSTCPKRRHRADPRPRPGRAREAQRLSHVNAGGRVIRTHGDLHLGQTMLGERGWVVLDFEGEPARPLPSGA